MNDIFSRSGISCTERPVLMLAPMEGITNPIFREMLCEIGGLDLVATEFIRISSNKIKINAPVKHSLPLQIQLMAACSVQLRSAIIQLRERGVLNQKDWIDLNVGCPSKTVNSKGAGAALLRHPKQLTDLICCVRQEHSGPFSIKTRVGYEDDLDYPKLLEVLKDCPLDFITIHARTRADAYSGSIKLQHLSSAVDQLPYPVIGNGEIWNSRDAMNMLTTCGVRGLMCGRGAVSNPYIFQDIRKSISAGCDSDNRIDRQHRLLQLKDFSLSLLQRYHRTAAGRFASVGTFKEFAFWLSRNTLVGQDFFEKLKRLQTLSEIEQMLSDFFDRKLKKL